MLKKFVVGLGILSALSVSAWAQDYEFYSVKADDTVEKLALRQRVTCDAVLQLNPQIKNGALPSPGVVIFLPTAPPLPHKPSKKVAASRSHHKEAEEKVSVREEKVERVRGGTTSELSEDEVEALYEGTVKPLGGPRAAEVAHLSPLALPDHRNTVVTSDGSTISIPTARPRPKPVKQREEAENSHSRRSLSSRRGIQAQGVLRHALKFMGVPYVWGGDTPNGFDCSGFVQHVYGRCGIPLPRTADLQFDVGKVIPKGKEQPGDLIYFETYCPGPSHIGIFLGRHQFVHASSAAGQITISDLREAHFQKCYLGAKRVF